MSTAAQDRFHHLGLDVGGEQAVQVDVAGVLGGHHDGVDPDRAVAVVLDGHLGLAVRPQVWHRTGLARPASPWASRCASVIGSGISSGVSSQA